jgi:hypothetical protein
MDDQSGKNPDRWALKVSIWTLAAWALLLVLGQLLISEWTVHASNNEEVVNYVSFAGTLVGIILAVLAIIYAFVSSLSQKDDASGLRFEIGKLNSAIESVRLSGDRFSDQVDGLQQIRSSLDDLVTSSEASKTVLENSREMIKNLVHRQEADKIAQQKVANTEVPPRSGDILDFKAIVSYLAQMALSYQITFYFLAIEYAKLGETDDRYFATEAQLVPSMFKKSYDHENNSNYRGDIHAYWLVLSDLNVFSDKDVLKEFRISLLKRSEIVKVDESHPMYSGEGIKASLTIVASSLREQLGS